MLKRFRGPLAILLIIAASAARAAAQEPPPGGEVSDPSELARFRFGPIRFTPWISLRDVGVDNNVFNETDDPKQDTVGALGPATNWWMHVGRSLMTGRSAVEYLYFDRYANQRAWNSDQALKWEVPLSRFTPFVAGTYSNTRTRSGFEIDSRLRQKAQNVVVGSEVALFSHTRLVMSAARSRLQYDDQESALAAQVASALDRWSNVERMQLRYKLTSLTMFVVNAEAVQDRFETEVFRNTDSIAVLPGFEMKPSALVSGRVFVGYRHFTPLREVIPPYRGPIASVDASYVFRATRFGIKVGRDLAFSYQAEQPYYALTDTTLDVTHRLTYSWDIVLRAGRQILDYTAIHTAQQLSVDPQVDTLRQYGGGIGYRLGRAFRLGVDGLYVHRTSSNVALREFENTRIGASITYGLPQ